MKDIIAHRAVSLRLANDIDDVWFLGSFRSLECASDVFWLEYTLSLAVEALSNLNVVNVALVLRHSYAVLIVVSKLLVLSDQTKVSVVYDTNDKRNVVCCSSSDFLYVECETEVTH